MSGYEYEPKAVQQWDELPQNTLLWDMNKHLETQITYWKNRALSAERRMLEHECQEDS